MRRKYLSKDEIIALENSNFILQRVQIIDKIDKDSGLDVSVKFRRKVIDYRENSMSPEKFAYRISWECQYTGQRDGAVYYPNTVGLQFTN